MQKKVEMPVQDPNIRKSNFSEVSLGYTEEMALEEAAKCLNCKTKPCVDLCPVAVQIPEFIMSIQAKEYEKAYKIITETNSLPAVCGRVCPQETQCESACIRGKKGEPVAIGRLERFVADRYMQNSEYTPEPVPASGYKAAVIGAGPAGLTCAGDLIKKGIAVTVYEALHVPGGVLSYGIPEFRLPKSIVTKEVDNLIKQGVDIQLNSVIGKIFSVDEILEKFDAVFIGTGAGLPTFMNIEGEDLIGVYSANELLTRVNLMNAYDDKFFTPLKPTKSIAVVGGGNVAMDAARCAKRVGAENVYIIYRRSEAEMPARLEEVHHAKEEGIEFMTLTNPIRILGDENGRVSSIECVKMELGEPDDSGRRRPVTIKGSEFTVDVDAVVMSIGTSPNPLISADTKDLETSKWGTLIVNDKMRTSKAKVFAGGDIVSGAATVINAMGHGKAAADTIASELLSVGYCE